MQVTRTSRISGIIRTIDLPITEEQLIDFGRGARVQDALWNLTPSQREFFMTGITEEEWEQFIAVSEESDHEAADEPDLGNTFTKNEDNYYDEN
jgi:hypothetical protein